MKKINYKNLKFSVNNTVVIVFCVVLVLLLNVAATLLESRVPGLKIDLTENSVTKIGMETKALLKTVDEGNVEIELVYLKGTSDEDAQVRDVLQQYDAYSENITYKAVNYHTNPVFLSSYGINSDANVDGSVLVARKDKSKARIVLASDMVMSYNNSTVYLLENLVTNAIGVIASDRQMTVCFTTGHGEIIEQVQTNPVSQSEEQGGLMLINLIKSENIGAYQYDISTGVIPEGIDLLIIMSPQKDFTVDEINNLDNYLNGGGNVAISLSSGVSLERLESYLSTWGLKVNNDIISETDTASSFDESGVYFYVQKTDHESVKSIDSRILASYAKSMTFTKTGDIEADVILTTSDKARSMPLTVDGIDSSNVTEGKFNLGYILEKPLNGSFENTAKMIVTSTESVWGITQDTVTTYDAMVYYSLSEKSFGNADFVMAMLSAAYGEEIQSIYVPVKSRQVSVLTMSEAQATVMSRLLCFIIPVIVLLCGIVVWLKRRNK